MNAEKGTTSDTNISGVCNILASCDNIHNDKEDKQHNDDDQHHVGVTQSVPEIGKYRIKVNWLRMNCNQVEAVCVEKLAPENDFAILDTLELKEITNRYKALVVLNPFLFKKKS